MFGAGYVKRTPIPLSSTSFVATQLTYIALARRRICPGMLVAEREIWLTIARMLWAFDMTEVPGERIDLNEYDGLSGRSPTPFRINIKPRFAEVENVLKKESGRWAVRV